MYTEQLQPAMLACNICNWECVQFEQQAKGWKHEYWTFFEVIKSIQIRIWQYWCIYCLYWVNIKKEAHVYLDLLRIKIFIYLWPLCVQIELYGTMIYQISNQWNRWSSKTFLNQFFIHYLRLWIRFILLDLYLLHVQSLKI